MGWRTPERQISPNMERSASVLVRDGESEGKDGNASGSGVHGRLGFLSEGGVSCVSMLPDTAATVHRRGN